MTGVGCRRLHLHEFPAYLTRIAAAVTTEDCLPVIDQLEASTPAH
jgi:hypothetical protein